MTAESGKPSGWPPAKLGALASADAFQALLHRLSLQLPCDEAILPAPESPLAAPLRVGALSAGNRFAIQPMEGWDGTPKGLPSDWTRRRWQRFGESGAKLIWGGEAVAVRHDGRANPNQLLLVPETRSGLEPLLAGLRQAHRARFGTTDDLVTGLQLTFSGRFCRPNRKDRLEPRILYHHPLLDARFGIPADAPVLSDGEIEDLVGCYVWAAMAAREMGFDFVDIKHCHGYLGHEFLSARTRPGRYGGSFENRTRFLREIVRGIRAQAPGLEIGVRLSAFDFIPFRPDPERSQPGHPGPGIPEVGSPDAPWPGFGVNALDPLRIDPGETFRFLSLLEQLGIRLVNVTAGSPYYNPHIQRPALYPPSDGYLPPEDPLIGVARQVDVTRAIKAAFPNLVVVGSAYSYLQQFLPHVAQAIVREGAADFVGLGRMVLAYPDLPRDVLEEGRLNAKQVCRTFSDCTTAPRHGMISGCFPLDPAYKQTPEAVALLQIKRGRKGAA